jgi:hypothetical protein
MGLLPMPDVANRTRSGCLFTHSANSGQLRTGRSLLMAIMSGMSATVEIGWKSFSGSNGCFSPSAALVASVVVPSRSVWPSGLDLATTSMPMMVLPPPRFSTMTC